MSAKNLVIVESPAKAKTIEKYLGSDFKVMSSVGHIRKDTKVDVANDFAVTYEIDEGHKKIVSDLKKAIKNVKTIWLATDEDREGESISWHLMEVLNLPKNTNRITFHEITKPALEEAVKHPRKVDMSMVSSQQARQTLDMLVGYDLSGVVRRKVPGAISAGRVQSPALRLVVEKEREIEKFNSKSTFKITGEFAKTGQKTSFTATLDGKGPDNTLKAKKLLESLVGAKYEVFSTDQTEALKPNPVPFATAALQIEANARLGFSSSTTMRAAQGLYQAGHITYHRTDSLNLSNQALGAIANYIKASYGEKYLKVRTFKTKSAGAQEAHEAIRPTHIENEDCGSNNFEKKLYHLIRSRTLATQMSNAIVNRTTIKLKANSPSDKRLATTGASAQTSPVTTGRSEARLAEGAVCFKATGEVVVFDGFLKVYGKSKDTELPNLSKGDLCDALEITARETFERPPARYTEGSLVKKLEELGIGRPSTYASIMSAIQARGYVVKGESEGIPREVAVLTLKDGKITEDVAEEKTGSVKGKLIPTPIGELVSDFLTDHFDQIVDYGFTADVEQKLDRIAEDKLNRVKMLRDFYTPFSKLVGKSDDIARYNNANALGKDPKTGENIYAKIGKNGGFIQLGENEKESGKKPRFAPLPDGETVKTVTLKQALKQLALPVLPRSLGFAKDGTEIIATAGPFGPYLKAGNYNVPIKDYDPYTITLAEAEPLYQAKIDSIIADWGDIMIINGAYGPYVKGPGRRNNAKIPKEIDPKKLTREKAEKILAEKPKSARHAPHRKTAKKSTKKTTKKAKTTKTKTRSAKK
ncbi:type I DNA topoisomerase [Candidatus Saccharibacteria bacterium]|nr:type I DNA topoisomerase [Candidatus Saccharibacteria bacterium]